jgi:hypothetical protein
MPDYIAQIVSCRTLSHRHLSHCVRFVPARSGGRAALAPAAVAITTGITILFISDDCPYGQYRDVKKHGTLPERSAAPT